MRTNIRETGNSSGAIIPKAILSERGASAGDPVDISVSDGRIVLARLARHPREGWEAAARAIAEAGDDHLAWPEFANADNDKLVW